MARFGHPKLGKYETIFNWLVWIPLALWPFYEVYKLSMKWKDELEDGYLVTGWFSYKKDIAAYEWVFWRSYSIHFFVIFTINSSVLYILKQLFPTKKEEILTVTSLVIITYMFSFNGAFLLLCHTSCYYLVTLFRNKKIMWFWAIAMISCIHFEKPREFIVHTVFRLNDEHREVMYYTTMVSYLRLISFGCYICERKSESFSFISCLSYTFYLPTLCNGPIITYDIFSACIKNEKKVDVMEVFKDLIMCLIQGVLLDGIFHFLYFSSIGQQPWILENLNATEVVAITWTQGHVFNYTYYIYYRFSGLFSKIDGLTPPGVPKCVATVYTFVDMWRNFDKGLYRLLQQCIYHPLGGSRSGLFWQTTASFLCFAFVGFWHDGSYTYVYWAITSWFGIMIETVALFLSKTRLMLILRYRMGSAMYRRLCALCGSFSVFGIIYTNIVFLLHLKAANILLKQAFVVTWYAPLCIMAALYFFTQCAIDVN